MKFLIHHVDGFPQPYPDRWAEFAGRRGVSWEYHDLSGVMSFRDLSNRFDAVLCRWSLSFPGRAQFPDILDILENEYGMLIYPDRKTRWSWDDKIRQNLLFAQYDVKMPRTFIFHLEKEALDWARSATYPVVFKLASGASSRNVVLVHSQSQARHLIRAMFEKGIRTGGELQAIHHGKTGRQWLSEWKRRLANSQEWRYRQSKETIEKSYVYFQELVPGNTCDTRISIIGDRAFGFRRYNRENDFRASGSGRIDWEPTQVSRKAIRIAFDLNKKCGFQCMAYDFVSDQSGEDVLLEACWTFADWAVQKCPGHWNPNLDWIPGPMWPEEAQIEDLIKLVETRRR